MNIRRKLNWILLNINKIGDFRIKILHTIPTLKKNEYFNNTEHASKIKQCFTRYPYCKDCDEKQCCSSCFLNLYNKQYIRYCSLCNKQGIKFTNDNCCSKCQKKLIESKIKTIKDFEVCNNMIYRCEYHKLGYLPRILILYKNYLFCSFECYYKLENDMYELARIKHSIITDKNIQSKIVKNFRSSLGEINLIKEIGKYL